MGYLIQMSKLMFHAFLKIPSDVLASNIRHDEFRPSSVCPLFVCNAQTTFPLDYETGWTWELWVKTNFLNWQT